jgi:ankyrin repeat protein
VEFLLGRPGIDTEAESAEGRRAIDLACGHRRRKSLNVVKLLVAAGARVNAQTRDTWGAFLAAVVGGNLQVVKYLVEEAGADERHTGPNRMTPLMHAAEKGHTAIVKYLLGRPGADLETRTEGGRETALDIACRMGHLDVVKLLVAAGARVDPQSRDQAAALVSAIINGNLQVVTYLVEEAGADVQRTNSSGKTALQMAVESGHVDIVEYLRLVISRREHQVGTKPYCKHMFHDSTV